MGIVRPVGLALASLLAAWTPARAQGVRVAAASDLQAVLPVIAARFEKETGSKVQVVFGSFGNFVTQIQNGAPFDVFLSADIDHPRRLERAGLAEPGTLYGYATGRIVLWTRNDSGIDLRKGLSILTASAVGRIAIANPEHAPYGRAAVAALRHEAVYDRVRGKLVLGENIAQAAQFVHSGNANVGILALSLALAPALKSAGTFVEIPASLHPPIEQAAVVLASSTHKAVARSFVDALKKPESISILRSYGFEVPPPASR